QDTESEKGGEGEHRTPSQTSIDANRAWDLFLNSLPLDAPEEANTHQCFAELGRTLLAGGEPAHGLSPQRRYTRRRADLFVRGGKRFRGNAVPTRDQHRTKENRI